MDVEAVLRGGRGVDISVAGGRRSQDPHRASRQRFTGPNGSALCVDIADSYLACGSGDYSARCQVWPYFSCNCPDLLAF